MTKKVKIVLAGMEKGVRVDSRILEERIQKAVTDGYRSIDIIAHGQHGIGGRLWKAGDRARPYQGIGDSRAANWLNGIP